MPPVVRFVLALVGASLVLWGAKGVVLNVPGIQEISLFEVSKAATWTLVFGSVLVVALVALRGMHQLSSPWTGWLRTPSLAWLAWTVALGAFCFMAWDRGYSFYKMILQYDEAKELGLALPDPRDFLRKSQIKPGLIGVIAGLVIQFVGVCLRGRQPAVAGNPGGAPDTALTRVFLNFPTFLASVALVAAFFLPWVFIFVEENEVGVSGIQLAEHFQGSAIHAAWAVPVLGLLLAAMHFARPFRLVHVLVGLAPLVVLARFACKEGGDLFKMLGAGAWMVLACGFLLVITTLRTNVRR